MTWPELKGSVEQQTEVFIPVPSLLKRETTVHACPHPGCRYLAKTPTEIARHVSHCHVEREAAPAPTAPALPPVVSTVSVVGCEPRLPPRKRRRLEAAAVDAEGNEVQGGSAVEGAEEAEVGEELMELAEESTGLAEEATELAEKSPPKMPKGNPALETAAPLPRMIAVSRKAAAQHTSRYWKEFLPQGAGITQDCVKHFRFVVSLDPKKLLCDPDRVAALAPHQKQDSKSFTFGKDAPSTRIDKAYVDALEWVWDKHLSLYGGERPEWSYLPFEDESENPAASSTA